MDKKQRRRLAFQDYMRKWCMSDYRVFVYRVLDKTYLVHKKAATRIITISVTAYFLNLILDGHKSTAEIVTISSFLKRFQLRDVEVVVYEDDDTYQSFYSLDEIKEYMLIQKIAGV